jgi:ribosomal protein L37AE/L43A
MRLTNQKKQKQIRRDGIPNCPTCGNHTFQTLVKGKKWMCRKCGHIREVSNG